MTSIELEVSGAGNFMKNWVSGKRRRKSDDFIDSLKLNPQEEGRKTTFLVLGNCQARGLTSCLQALNGQVFAKAIEVPLTDLALRITKREAKLYEILNEYDHILVQPPFKSMIEDNYGGLSEKIQLFPAVQFSAYHPDLVYILVRSSRLFLHGPLGHYNSAIALWGYLNGRSVVETAELFNQDTYRTLGYFDFWHSSRESLMMEGKRTGFAFEDHLSEWTRRGAFMHSTNHPMLYVLSDIAKHLLAGLGLPFASGATNYLNDENADGPVWPVYPAIARCFGIEGSYEFKIEKGSSTADRPVVMLGLDQFIQLSYDAFSKYGRDDLACERILQPQYERLANYGPDTESVKEVKPEPTRTDVTDRKQTTSPYHGLPSSRFWRSAIANIPMSEVDPIVESKLHLSRETKIATAGSCFAQNISQTLRRNGFNFYIAEKTDGLSLAGSTEQSHGVYSARYGNIYTARQLLQLFDRAHHLFTPSESAWLRPDGKLVDPFRPQIVADGFDSESELELARNAHLAAVKLMFAQLDVFIFTLGLTECWRSTSDGAVFPLAPGVIAGKMDETRFEFVNFSVQEVVADLSEFLIKLGGVNKSARVVLTVSPVPLVATYEAQHVLVSTTHSKSVLRAAAGEICKHSKSCVYFPSFEIITGNYTKGAYYETNLRTVTQAGVDQVMNIFMRHFADQRSVATTSQTLMDEFDSVREIICDEERIADKVFNVS